LDWKIRGGGRCCRCLGVVLKRGWRGFDTLEDDGVTIELAEYRCTIALQTTIELGGSISFLLCCIEAR